MFEKFNLKQPAGSNACGAYALAALLSAWQRHRFEHQEAVDNLYRYIGECQSALPTDKYADFISVDYMSLPSSLIKTGLNNGFTGKVTVYYRSDLPAGLSALVEEEKIRIGEMACVIKSDAPLEELTAQYGFYLLLSNKGKHWITLSHHSQGLFFYDPACGSEKASLKENRLYLKERAADFSGVAIYFTW